MKKTKAEILKKIHGGQVCQIVSTAARLEIADHLDESPLTPEELATKISVDCEALKRLLSSLAALHLLEEKEEKLRLTDEGLHLRKSDPSSVHALAVYKGSPAVWGALGALCDGVRLGQSPFELAFGQDFFAYLAENEEAMTYFQNAMTRYVEESSTKILDLYDFSPFRRFLDVGGGSGAFAKLLVERAPHLKGAVFDLPSVVKTTQNGDITFIAGNFFEAVPKGYDAYIMRNILHDWSDLKALSLLQSIHKACGNQSTLLIFETFYQKNSTSRLGRFSDLAMFTLTPGGKERSFKEIETLLEEAGFQVTRTYQTTSAKSLVEAKPKHSLPAT